jgi:antimicrobial peptide system SdpA family protein
MNEKPSLHPSTLGAFTLGILAIATTLAVYAIHGSLPHNPLHLPHEEQVETAVWAPESWKFFTRDPLEPTLVALRPDGADWSSATRMPYARPVNMFGMDRTVRAQGVELGSLVGKVPRSAWTACDEAPTACLSRASIGASVVNRTPLPTLCGTIGIVSQKPLPWAWASARRPIAMPSQVVRLEIKC